MQDRCQSTSAAVAVATEATVEEGFVRFCSVREGVQYAENEEEISGGGK